VKRLLQQVSPWIEPAQFFEKNQLGFGRMLFNNPQLARQVSLWTDSAEPSGFRLERFHICVCTTHRNSVHCANWKIAQSGTVSFKKRSLQKIFHPFHPSQYFWQ
jgi:hypothetical protein